MNTPLKPTNVAFVDSVLAGGTKPEGVYGILGPTGVGKSMLAAMIAANSAIGPSVFLKCLKPSLPWALLDLHNGWNCTQPRIISHVAQIRRDCLMHKSDELAPYEHRRSPDLPKLNGAVMPSSVRRQMASSILKERLLLLDNYPGSTFDYSKATPEYINWALHHVVQSRGGLGGIVIDGARNVWYASQQESRVTERLFLDQLVSSFCRGLAKRYHCPVWITHQIAAAKCNSCPAKTLSHRDAADCKTFADTMDACLVLGTASEPNPLSVFSIHCSKGDRCMIERGRILLHHDPDFASITVAAGYQLDKRTQSWKRSRRKRTLLSRNDLAHVDELLRTTR